MLERVLKFRRRVGAACWSGVLERRVGAACWSGLLERPVGAAYWSRPTIEKDLYSVSKSNLFKSFI